MDSKRVMLNGSKGELVAKLRDYIQYEKLPYDIKGLAERPYAFIFKDHVYIRGNDIKFTEESYQERFKDKWVKFFKDRSVVLYREVR
jgi:hypothetical protein